MNFKIDYIMVSIFSQANFLNIFSLKGAFMIYTKYLKHIREGDFY